MAACCSAHCGKGTLIFHAPTCLSLRDFSYSVARVSVAVTFTRLAVEMALLDSQVLEPWATKACDVLSHSTRVERKA